MQWLLKNIWHSNKKEKSKWTLKKAIQKIQKGFKKCRINNLNLQLTKATKVASTCYAFYMVRLDYDVSWTSQASTVHKLRILHNKSHSVTKNGQRVVK